jgi:uncharacterized ParB-like nuclease family protein
MARRKRLDLGERPAGGAGMAEGGAFAQGVAAPPVARVAGDAAGSAALQEMADFIAQARAEGRLIAALPLKAVEEDHLARDRMMPAEGRAGPGEEAGGENGPEEGTPEAEMAALTDSLRARGQQVPIDVVRLRNRPGERYGLVSGLRRLTALRRLHAETGEARFATVKARVIAPQNAAQAYLSMVEENEIRAGLSFYERARVALRAAEAGAYADEAAALRGLWANVSRAKRSKIGSFMAVARALDGALRFPTALSEKRGLALARALAEDEGLAARLRAALEADPPADAEAERAVIEREARGVSRAKRPAPKEGNGEGDGPPVRPPVQLRAARGRLVLSGPGVDDALRAELEAWLAAREAGQARDMARDMARDWAKDWARDSARDPGE